MATFFSGMRGFSMRGFPRSRSLLKPRMPGIAALVSPLLLLLAPFQAVAGPAECAAIIHSFSAMADQQGYRQVVEMAKSNFRIEQIVLGNTIYTNTDGKWMKLGLKPGGRKEIVAQIMSETAVSDCSETGVDTLPGGRAKVFEFTLSPPKGIPGGKPTRQKIWISSSDGLVRRMVGEDVKIELSFDKLTPPIP
jgi:hypothetical protein